MGVRWGAHRNEVWGALALAPPPIRDGHLPCCSSQAVTVKITNAGLAWEVPRAGPTVTLPPALSLCGRGTCHSFNFIKEGGERGNAAFSPWSIPLPEAINLQACDLWLRTADK